MRVLSGTDHSRSLSRRIESTRFRIEALSNLRETVKLPPEYDITKRQWQVLTLELQAAEMRLLRRLKRGARTYLAKVDDTSEARSLNSHLGDIELETTRAFAFFDTYMDVLTQRHTPELGRMLAGCDVLAWEALNRPHPALAIVEPPLVYCDRGHGASTIREGVSLPGRAYNPVPLIQIPFSRLKEKVNLTSILHEAGHEAMVRCGLRSALVEEFRSGLLKSGASSPVADLYSLWSSEIGPDFWAFCLSGLAQAGSMKEIVALPPSYVFRISWTDPHPPPYIRALLSFDWCRQVWGEGIWDKWEKEWLDLYPLDAVPVSIRTLIKRLRVYIPVVGRMLLRRRFRSLRGRTITSMFGLRTMLPAELRRRIGKGKDTPIDMRGLSVTSQLAVFRLLKEMGKMSEESLDKAMTAWLLRLAEQRKQLH